MDELPTLDEISKMPSPPTNEVTDIEPFKNLSDMKKRFLDVLAPLAFHTYESLMLSGSEKMRKSAADAVMKVIDAISTNTQKGDSGVSFSFSPEALKTLMGGAEKVLKGVVDEREVN